MRAPPSRLLVAVVLLVVVVALAAGLSTPPGGERPDRDAGAATRDRLAPLAVLRAWDDARAAAWRQGDLRVLARLYVAGSRAGRADRAMLAAYVDRGLRVEGLRMQVAEVRVEAAGRHRIALVVTDRLAGGEAVGRDGRTTLPRDTWSRRRVVLVRQAGVWRASEVTPATGAQERPAASTAETSGSANS